MNPEQAKQFIDHAAKQDDRWLFIALLVGGAIVFVVGIWWLSRQYQTTLNQWRADVMAMASDHRAEVKELHAERVKASESFASEIKAVQAKIETSAQETVRAYTEVLLRNAEALGGVKNALTELQRACAISRQHGPPDPQRGGVAH